MKTQSQTTPNQEPKNYFGVDHLFFGRVFDDQWFEQASTITVSDKAYAGSNEALFCEKNPGNCLFGALLLVAGP